MSSMSCLGCNKQISNSAEICPECNIPITLSIISIKEKGIKFEIQIILSLIVLLNGLLLSYFGSDISSSDIVSKYIPATLFIIGLIWYLYAVCKLWWLNRLKL